MMRMVYFERGDGVKIKRITSDWIEVELTLFLCQGLLKRMGISLVFGLAWEGEWFTAFLAGAVPRFFFNSGVSL